MPISHAQVKVWVLCTPKADTNVLHPWSPQAPNSQINCVFVSIETMFYYEGSYPSPWFSCLSHSWVLTPLSVYLPSQPVPRKHPSPVLMGRILLGGKGRVGEINSPAASLPGYASEHSACQRSQLHVEGSHTCTQIKAIFFKTSEDEIKFQTLNHLSNLRIWHICIAWAYR